MTVSYHVRIADTAGDVVAVLDDKGGFLRLAFTHLVNGVGVYTLEMRGDDPRVTDIWGADLKGGLDYKIEVWRANPTRDLAPYNEFEGLHRTPVLQYPTGRRPLIFRSHGFGLNHFLRADIAHKSGTPGAAKSGPGETVMKDYVRENIGPDATTANNRRSDGVLPNLTIEADAGQGSNWSGSRSFKQLLKALQGIAANTGLDFDIVGNGPGAFQFRTYLGQRGEDRSELGLDRSTGLNSAGNAPVVFSPERHNMVQPVWSYNRSDEVNRWYILGQGQKSIREVEVQETPALQDDSPWNIREAHRGALQEVGAQLTTKGEELLEESEPKEKFSFEIKQTPETYYGKDFTWGDIAQARFGPVDTRIKIVGVQVTVDARGDQPAEVLDFEYEQES